MDTGHSNFAGGVYAPSASPDRKRPASGNAAQSAGDPRRTRRRAATADSAYKPEQFRSRANPNIAFRADSEEEDDARPPSPTVGSQARSRAPAGASGSFPGTPRSGQQPAPFTLQSWVGSHNPGYTAFNAAADPSP